jgi:hypothetical protein
MLESLPWPKHLKNVPEYAGGHHERMDGKGYPRGLTRDQMSVQARHHGDRRHLRGADRRRPPRTRRARCCRSRCASSATFAPERPYRPDLFDIFIRSKIYLQFALKNMEAQQIDEIDEALIPGYTP